MLIKPNYRYQEGVFSALFWTTVVLVSFAYATQHRLLFYWIAMSIQFAVIAVHARKQREKRLAWIMHIIFFLFAAATATIPIIR